MLHGSLLRAALVGLSFVTLSGCSLLVSSTLDDKKNGADGDSGVAPDGGDGGDGGGFPVDCKDDDGASLPNETPCGDAAFCFNGACIPVVCGDGIVVESLGEECDEGDEKNMDDADGCTMLCQHTCREAADCSNGNDCDGVDSCNEDNVCVVGEPLEDGDTCTTSASGAGTCMNEVCVPLDCGDGETSGDEECDRSDPNNGANEANCKADCTWTCNSDFDCATGDLCETWTCNTDEHLCYQGDPVGCSPSDSCRFSYCDPTTGQCVEGFHIDNDTDGFSGIACDDTSLDEIEGEGCDEDANRNPLQADLCGDEVDNDCNGVIDDGTPTWYLDLDGDGYGSSVAPTLASCTQPADYVGNDRDCQDDAKTYNNAGNAFPGQTKDLRVPFGGSCAATGSSTSCWDYNCNGVTERAYLPIDCSAFTACKASTYGSTPESEKPLPCGTYLEVYQCQYSSDFIIIKSCGPVLVGRDYQTCK